MEDGSTAMPSARPGLPSSSSVCLGSPRPLGRSALYEACFIVSEGSNSQVWFEPMGEPRVDDWLGKHRAPWRRKQRKARMS